MIKKAVLVLLIVSNFSCSNKDGEILIPILEKKETWLTLTIDKKSTLYQPNTNILKWEFDGENIYLITNKNEFLQFDSLGNIITSEVISRVNLDIQKKPANYPQGMLSDFWVQNDQYGFLLLGKNQLKLFDENFEEKKHYELNELFESNSLNFYFLFQISKNEILIIKRSDGKQNWNFNVLEFSSGDFINSFEVNFPVPINKLVISQFDNKLLLGDSKADFLATYDIKAGLIVEKDLFQRIDTFGNNQTLFNELFPKGFQNGLRDSGFIKSLYFEKETKFLILNMNLKKRYEGLADPYYLLTVTDKSLSLKQFKDIDYVDFDNRANLKFVKTVDGEIQLSILPISEYLSDF